MSFISKGGRSAWAWAAALIFIGVLAGLAVSSRMDLMNAGIAVVEPPSIKGSAALMQISEGLADVAQAVTPSVVNISTTKIVKQENQTSPLFEDPFFRRFFGEPGGGQQREFKERSLGSGVIVSSEGYIVTNNHVVEGAEEIKVSLSDRRDFKGKVVGSDPRSDVAVIKIEARDLPAISWADSDKLRPGEMVMAVGSPFGLAQTVTVGIISAVGRANVGINDYEDFIQTDAAINPGNSGGALVNMKGRLAGINTAIFSRSGGYQGIGFAVPSNMVRQVMDSLIKTGRVVRGWLGVSVQDITPQLAKRFGLKGLEGALVSDVVKGSPAEKAGMKGGDVISGVGGRKVEDSGHLRLTISQLPVNGRVMLDVIRDRKKMQVSVVIGELPKGVEASAGGGETPPPESALSGVAVQDLTPEVLDKLGLAPGTKGVVVMSVEPGSAADEAGLTRGDVITSINQKQAAGVKGFNELVSKLGKDEPVLLLINRQGMTLWMSISPAD